jgi:hypothetical protein
MRLQLWIHKILHWEYWPYQVVYIPVYFQYLLYVIYTRSFFYINAVNPSFKNGGFWMNSKKEIYDLIPKEYYPTTILVKPNENFEQLFENIIQQNISFPLIVKPDIGLRGTAVKRIFTKAELKHYHHTTPFDYLVQQLIPYENEIGLFYVQLPNQPGKITGIVSKEFMIITGNGKNTIRELLHQDKRYLLQLKDLETTHQVVLNTILNVDESMNLVPFGNHCRGTKFIDISYKITPELNENIQKLCNQIEGFYYGRMDIMFSNFDDLAKGENFQIVEINGAISEPTHMYDPSHSLLFGWKELIRHFHYMFLISKDNHKKGTPYLRTKDVWKEYKKHKIHYNTIRNR